MKNLYIIILSYLKGINVAIVEDSTEFDISEGQMFNCTPIVSCNETIESITWEINGTRNNSLTNETGQSVEANKYGNYTCIVTNGNMTATITYFLYGKIFTLVQACLKYSNRVYSSFAMHTNQ